MEVLKNILVDSLNGFASKDIPFFIFQLLVAGLLSHLFQLVWNRKYKQNALKSHALIGTGFALLTIFAKCSLPFSVMALGVIIWMSRGERKETKETIPSLVIGVLGVGVGSGNVLLTLIGLFVLVAIIWFSPSIKADEESN